MSSRVSVAFDQDTLAWDVFWTELDVDYPSLVTSWSIDRGRQYELDRCDTGRATVTIADRDGVLDPSNPDHDWELGPLLQVRLMRHNPVTDVWSTRFRGFIEELNYEWHPSQKVNVLTMDLVDIFEIIATVEMHPGHFGDSPPSGSEGQVFFEDTPTSAPPWGMQTRVWAVLGPFGVGLADEWHNVFSGNVAIHETIYSAGESAMTAVQEACDAEFPSVGNVYADRKGVLQVHGRYARFDPVGTAAATTGWDFHDWKAGDGAAVAASPDDTAHIRVFGTNRGLSKIVNQGMAVPIRNTDFTPPGDADIAGQVVQASGSIAKYGIRPWSAQNLLTKYGITDDLVALDECKRFAQYYVDNYKAIKTIGGVDHRAPITRIPSVGFRSMHPEADGAGANWALLSTCDIGDRLTVTIAAPGGGGFSGDDLASQHLVEGVHEEVHPLQPGYDDVTLTLDLSPFAYQESNPFAPLP